MSTTILKTDETAIRFAAEALADGRLVAFPTETVYGLGADAGNESAVSGIFAAKGRPADNPLIIHVSDAAKAADIAFFNPLSLSLAERFWPGPLTLVLPARPNGPVSAMVTAGQNTVGIRVPSHPVALALLRASNLPVAAPSANRSNHVSPTRSEHVIEDLGNAVDIILDGGDCEFGLESTILEPGDGEITLLRPGAITVSDIASAVGFLPTASKRCDSSMSPGQMPVHYSPQSRLRINAQTASSDEILLGFGNTNDSAFNLSRSGNLMEAAANFYSLLRLADQLVKQNQMAGIAVAPIPEYGIGHTINDRLKRGAGVSREIHER